MSALTFTVTGAIPQLVHGDTYTETTAVHNTSTVDTVWLTNLPNNSGFALRPGSTITWDSRQGLYLYALAGTTVAVEVVDNGGSLTDAGAIAGQIIAQGLAPAIAKSILAAASNRNSSVTAVEAGGIITATFLAPGPGYQWLIQRITVSCTSTTPTVATCYDSTVSPAYIVDTTPRGNLDIADENSPILIDTLRALVVQWTNVSAGASATVRIQYQLVTL